MILQNSNAFMVGSLEEEEEEADTRTTSEKMVARGKITGN